MKKRRILFILLGVFAVVVLLVIGAAGGAALSNAFLDTQPAQAAFHFVSDVQSEAGILISSVAEDSPAAEAGLVRGDILLAVDGQEVNSLPQLLKRLKEYEPGDAVELTVLHGDDTRTLEANLGDHEGSAFLGISACNGFSVDIEPFVEPIEGDFEEFTIAMGARIVAITADSPADAAGLVIGDIILSVDGVKISPDDDFAELIRSHNPGDTVTLEVLSSGDEAPHEVKVKLAQHPDEVDQAYLGVKYRWSPEFPAVDFRNFPRTPLFFHLEMFDHQFPEDHVHDGHFFFGVPGLKLLPHKHGNIELPEGVKSAAIIGEVLPGSPAEDAGLKAGDVVLLLDGQPLDSPRDLSESVRALAPGDEITLTIYRYGEEIEIVVTLARHPDDPEVGYLGVSLIGFINENGKLPPDFFDEHFEEPNKIHTGEA